LQNGDKIQGGETVLLVEVVSGEAAANSAPGQDPGKPIIVAGHCINCGRREEAQVATSDEHLTFLCEDCRAELRNTPQPIPGYEMIRVLGRGGMGCVTLARDQK